MHLDDLPPELRVTAEGPVRIVTLNRPDELNACNEALHNGLARVWRYLGADSGARAAVLTGAGRTFCAGGDFTWLQQINSDPARAAKAMQEAAELAHEMLSFPLPVVAAVNGPAVGLGCSLTVLSDLVVMADTAHLADPHVPVGLAAGDGGMFWPLLTGMHRAKEFLFLGSKVSAHEALSLGLANRVVERDQVLAESIALARRLAALPAQALRDTKQALNTIMSGTANPGLQVALVAERTSMTSAEHGEKLARFATPVPSEKG